MDNVQNCDSHLFHVIVSMTEQWIVSWTEHTNRMNKLRPYFSLCNSEPVKRSWRAANAISKPGGNCGGARDTGPHEKSR
jgi:hypothetical protein